MNPNNLRFVQGALVEGKPATIRFMDDVEWWTVSSFTDELEWLGEYIKPSKITILINSAGGSVIHGMSAFSSIINCKIPTEAIVEGLAASMASILLAAADDIKMRDYGIIMIHNPFNPDSEDEDSATIAFKEQLKTIYKNRWGFTEDKINEVMNGKDGEDGTFINADLAVELGIVSADNVIKTKKQKKDSIESQVKVAETIDAIAKVYAKIDLDNLSGKTNVKKPDIKNDNNNKPKEMDELKIVVAALGAKDCNTEADVISVINSLKKDASELAGVKETVNSLKLEKVTAEAQLKKANDSLKDITDKLSLTEASLNEYKAKEEAKKEADKVEFIENAIKEGRISEDAKATWVALANVNFESVKAAIEGLDKKVVISDAIVNGTNAIVKQMTAEEADTAKKVKNVVGEDFTYSTSFNQ